MTGSFAFAMFFFILCSYGGISSPRVFLTLSSLVGKSDGGVLQREIEMNWEMEETSVNDTSPWVGLFDQDPFLSIDDPLVKVNITNETAGYQRSYISFPTLEFHPENLTDDCLGYWVAYISDNEVVSSSCYKAQPFWMEQHSHIIGNRSLDQLMIPGTHNAGSYQAYDPARNSLLVRYLMAQDESVWNQLVYGNRFLDLRVAYVNDDFWITHGIFKTDVLLKHVLEEVRRFVNLTNEIVIIDFHRFEIGFSGTEGFYAHTELISLLEDQLRDLMVPVSYGYNVPLNKLWEENRRIYVGYANLARIGSEYLFRGVSHQWADSDNVRDLEEYFNRTVCKVNRNNLISSMAHLTPKTGGIIFDTYGGLRKMAQKTNLIVQRWFRERWWNCANIVSTDYFHGSNVINVAIESNRRRWGSE